MNKTVWAGIIIFVIVLGITGGIIVHVFNDEKIEQATIQQVKEINRSLENQIVVETASHEEKTSPNTVIVFDVYYNQCGHSKTTKKKIENSEVNKTEDEIKKFYSNWKVKKFNSSEVVLYREENAMCDDHYMIKENNGHVTVYSIDGKGNEELKQETDISTQYLPDEDIEMLKNGIKANSQSELEQVLSDYD